MSEVAALEPVQAAIAGTGIRLQLVVPRPDVEHRSVVLHDRALDADGWFSGYCRRSIAVDPADLISGAVDLLADPAPDHRGRDAPATDGPAIDVLLCGHGSRDRCCGSMGTALAMAATAEGLEVRRTSHTGGHRFAPTGLVLPHGTAWAFLDEDALGRIVSMAGPVDDLIPHYRGSSAFATPASQAAERVAFAAVGWPWLGYRRRVTELEPVEPVGAGEPAETRVLVEGIDPHGRLRSWTVETAAGRRLPVPECGRDPSTAPKSETEVVIREGQEITA